MSIRKKSFILVALVALVLNVLIIYAVSELFISRFDRLELTKSHEDIFRVREAFELELTNLSTKLSDWSSWDDTYKYIRTKDAAYIDSNIQPQTFISLHLDTIVYVNEQRTIVSAAAYDTNTKELSASISGSLEQLILSSEKFYKVQKNGDEVRGIVMIDSRPLMIAARPILTSSGDGPRNGVIFFGRWVTQDLVNAIAFRLKAPLTFEIIGPEAARSDHMKEELSKHEAVIVEPESDSVMEADLFYDDIFGNPAIYFHLLIPRDIHAQGYAVARIVGFVTLGLGVVFTLLIIVIIDRLVIRRVIRVSDAVSRVGAAGDLSRRVEDSMQDDEISQLVSTINATLDSLEAAQGQLSNERLRVKQYIDSAGVLFVALDVHGVVLLVNNKACTVLGTRREECIGKLWFEFAVPQVSRETLLSTFLAIQNTEKGTEIDYVEYPILDGKHDSRLIGWHTTVLYDDVGQVSSVLLSGEDVTDERENEQSLKKKNTELEAAKSAMLNILEDEKHLEEQLKQEKESVERKVVLRTQELVDEKAKLLASINSLNVGYLLCDVHGRVLTSNTRMEKLFPRMHQNSPILLEHLALSLGSDVHVHEEFRRAVDHRETITHETISYGNRFLRLVLIPVILPQTGYVIGVVFLAEDITERKILERSRDEFFSIASHELRTPLTAIRGNTSMMLEYFGSALSDPQLHEMVDDIHESSIRLIGIVNDFLNVSRLEQKRLSYQITPVDIMKLCNDVIQEYSADGSHRALAMQCIAATPHIPLVFADKDRLREVLINLIGNSLKFTEHGGITVYLEKIGEMVEVQIQDTGRGISLANQPLLFHKFQQATDNLFTRDTTKGTGLGLYISKLMIEGMGGSIRLVKSEEGKGTIMGIQLPVST